jgi:hypothetical protein
MSESQNFRSYCDKHTPKEYRERVDVNYYLQLAHQQLSVELPVLPTTPTPLTASATTTPSNSPSKHKKKRIKRESSETKPGNGIVSVFSTTAPVIPAIILKKIASLDSPLMPKKRIELITAICKYWSLKKEARRGAALLKRLHLEVNKRVISSLGLLTLRLVKKMMSLKLKDTKLWLHYVKILR